MLGENENQWEHADIETRLITNCPEHFKITPSSGIAVENTFAYPWSYQK